VLLVAALASTPKVRSWISNSYRGPGRWLRGLSLLPAVCFAVVGGVVITLLAIFRAVVGLGPAGAGTGTGSSTSKGCCEAAPAIPLPNPIAPIAASASAIPSVARVSGPRAFEIANMFRNKEITPQTPLKHRVLQTLKSLR
jgi:hypothetical protein